MNYDDIKLGIIGKIKVWNQRKIAEQLRNQYYKEEGKILEVDYSEAEKLEADLLEKKRIKKATRDAARLYKRFYGKNNDKPGKLHFIEDFLVEHGLKQMALPESETSKKHNFIEQYSTEKSEEEKMNQAKSLQSRGKEEKIKFEQEVLQNKQEQEEVR